MFLYDNVDTLDLHGLDRDYARILIEEFIYDHYKMKHNYVKIVHGNGKGILKKVVLETLKKNKYVERYEIDLFNSGSTTVKIKETN